MCTRTLKRRIERKNDPFKRSYSGHLKKILQWPLNEKSYSGHFKKSYSGLFNVTVVILKKLEEATLKKNEILWPVGYIGHN